MLIHDRSTAAGSVMGVVAIVFLVGQQLSILFGLLGYMSVLVDHTQADIWVITANTRNANASGSLPLRYVDRLAGFGAVEWAEPVVTSAGLFKTSDGRYQGVQVVGLARPDLVGGPWRFAEGSIADILDLEGVTIDGTDLDVLGYPEVGLIAEIGQQRIRIGGVTQSIRGFEGTLVFTNIDNARRMGEVPPDRCTSILVKLVGGADPDATIAQLRQALPRAEVMSREELSRSTRLYYLTNTGIGGSFGFSTLIGTLVGIVIITLTMYTAVLNRQKDFAILRALGARKRDILVCIFYQALVVGAVGILLGFLLLSVFLLATQDSSLPSHMPLWVPPIHAVFTFILCLLGSVLAMRRALKIEPASAFR